MRLWGDKCGQPSCLKKNREFPEIRFLPPRVFFTLLPLCKFFFELPGAPSSPNLSLCNLSYLLFFFEAPCFFSLAGRAKWPFPSSLTLCFVSFPLLVSSLFSKKPPPLFSLKLLLLMCSLDLTFSLLFISENRSSPLPPSFHLTFHQTFSI